MGISKNGANVKCAYSEIRTGIKFNVTREKKKSKKKIITTAIGKWAWASSDWKNSK